MYNNPFVDFDNPDINFLFNDIKKDNTNLLEDRIAELNDRIDQLQSQLEQANQNISLRDEQISNMYRICCYNYSYIQNLEIVINEQNNDIIDLHRRINELDINNISAKIDNYENVIKDLKYISHLKLHNSLVNKKTFLDVLKSPNDKNKRR